MCPLSPRNKTDNEQHYDNNNSYIYIAYESIPWDAQGSYKVQSNLSIATTQGKHKKVAFVDRFL